MADKPHDEPDTWKQTLEQAVGLIEGVELDHPANTQLKQAAAPFIAYVDGLSDAD